jgi:GNAT superfamily N-acetyltransferase
MHFKIKKLTRKTKSFKKRLAKRLRAYTQAKGGPFHEKEMVLGVAGEKGKWAGGLVGLTYWNVLYVDLLWVEAKYRKRGVGRQLLERAELEARQKGCTLAHVNTHSLQAPDFYRKMGYKVYGKLRGFPKGQSGYSFYKKL